MKKFAFGLSAAVLISAATIPAFADTIVNTEIQEGPPAVVDSWMEPTVFRSREVKTSDGETQVIREPLVQERHERVVIPTDERTTTTVISEPRVIRKVESKTAIRTVASAPRKKVRRAHKRKSAVAYRRPAAKRDRLISQKTVEEYVEPTVLQQTEQNVHRDVVIERRHPALELY